MFNLFTKKQYQDINASEFAEALKQKDTVILDVRTPAEFNGGHIPGAKNLDLMGPAFAQEVARLDKDKTYLVYCRSGNRSGAACGLMAKQGFEKLNNLRGGIAAWQGPVK